MSDVLIACLYTPCFLIYLALIAQGIRQLRAGAVALPFWGRLLVPQSRITSNTPAMIYTIAQIISRSIVIVGVVLAISQSNIWLLIGAGFLSILTQVFALGYLYLTFRDALILNPAGGDIIQGETSQQDEEDENPSLPPGK